MCLKSHLCENRHYENTLYQSSVKLNSSTIHEKTTLNQKSFDKNVFHQKIKYH